MPRGHHDSWMIMSHDSFISSVITWIMIHESWFRIIYLDQTRPTISTCSLSAIYSLQCPISITSSSSYYWPHFPYTPESQICLMFSTRQVLLCILSISLLPHFSVAQRNRQQVFIKNPGNPGFNGSVGCAARPRDGKVTGSSSSLEQFWLLKEHDFFFRTNFLQSKQLAVLGSRLRSSSHNYCSTSGRLGGSWSAHGCKSHI